MITKTRLTAAAAAVVLLFGAPVALGATAHADSSPASRPAAGPAAGTPTPTPTPTGAGTDSNPWD